jgi:AraC-like DNA-binding protein
MVDSQRTRLPTASGALARLAARQAADAGVDVAPLLAAAGLTAAQMADPDARLDAKRQIIFIAAVARALGRDRLGFELGQNFDLRTIGLLYYVAASAGTLIEAARRIERYGSVGNEGAIFRCGHDGHLEIRVDYVGVARHSDRQQVEFFLATIVRLCRSLTGLSLRPERVSIAHSRSGDVADYDRFFGCRTTFHADRDAVVFKDECRDLPVVTADPHLSDILLRYCEDTLASRRRGTGTLRTQVENAIAPLLPHGKPTIAAIAQILHVSTRTLARRLAEEDASFASVLEDMRRHLSLRYLDDPDLSISEIAWLLGYREVGAFTHAFRRWTGASPSELRRSAGGPEALHAAAGASRRRSP